MIRSKAILVSLAAAGLFSASPAFAADAVRSAEALPRTASVVDAGSSVGCVAPLGSSSANKGSAPLSCGQWSAGAGGEGHYGAFGSGDSWWILLLVAAGAAALILALTGDGNDSPG